LREEIWTKTDAGIVPILGAGYVDPQLFAGSPLKRNNPFIQQQNNDYCNDQHNRGHLNKGANPAISVICTLFDFTHE
jgi:hypothetical protein